MGSPQGRISEQIIERDKLLRIFLLFHIVHDLLNHHFCESVTLRTHSFDDLFFVRDDSSTLRARAREWSGNGESVLARIGGRGHRHAARFVRTFQNDGAHEGGGITTSSPAAKDTTQIKHYTTQYRNNDNNNITTNIVHISVGDT